MPLEDQILALADTGVKADPSLIESYCTTATHNENMYFGKESAYLYNLLFEQHSGYNKTPKAYCVDKLTSEHNEHRDIGNLFFFFS